MANDIVTPEVLSRLDAPAWTRSFPAAVDRVLGIIEFDLIGQIRWANKAYLDMFGYSLDQVEGKHHRVFRPDHVTGSLTYEDFWRRPGAGRTESGEFLRMTSAGPDVWLQASYNPAHDSAGQLTGVVRFATDFTSDVRRQAEAAARLSVVDQTICCTELSRDANVITVNHRLLSVLGNTPRLCAA